MSKKMAQALAFDVYGTLIDTNGVETLLQEIFGDVAAEFSKIWRSKQLEYSFRRALMKDYVPFSVCTKEAMLFTAGVLKLTLTDEQIRQLMEKYRELPAFPDVAPALSKLNTQGYQLLAFSNGEFNAVEALLKHSGLSEFFSAIVSCDEVRSFKPDPLVYQHLLDKSNQQENKSQVWLISSNPFDVTGAKSFGLSAAWINRQGSNQFDPWTTVSTKAVHESGQEKRHYQPDMVCENLGELHQTLAAQE